MNSESTIGESLAIDFPAARKPPQSSPPSGQLATTSLKLGHLVSEHWRRDAADGWMSAIGHRFGQSLGLQWVGTCQSREKTERLLWV